MTNEEILDNELDSVAGGMNACSNESDAYIVVVDKKRAHIPDKGRAYIPADD